MGQATRTATFEPAPARAAHPMAREAGAEQEVREFARAMDAYKRESGRLFPTWSEVLEVLVALGYRKAAQAGRDAVAAGRLRDPGVPGEATQNDPPGWTPT